MKNSFQSIPLATLEANKTHLDIWQFSLKEAPLSILNLLNSQEIARAERYYFERHRRRFSIARGMMRYILGLYLQEDPKLIHFGESKYGKPLLPQSPWLTFNLSHSQDLALLAVGHTHAMGIDLEFFSARAYLGISHQMFSPTEYQAFIQLPASLQPLSFFQTWSQKEALIKACGLGLSYPTQEFDVPTLPSSIQSVRDTKHATNWSMRSFMPSLGCCAAICYHPSIQRIRYSTDIFERL